jgi:outer membrane protein
VQVSIRKVLLGAFVSAALAVPAMAEKIGVVEYGRLFNDSQQAKLLNESLDAEFGPRYKQLIELEKALKAKSDKLQKDAATMTADQKSRAEKDMRDGLREFERKGKELKDDSEAKRNEEVAKLQRVVDNEIREYAKAQNFDLVLMQGVIYATPAVNITDAVLNALNARAPRPAAAPSAGAATPKPQPKQP